MVEKEGGRRCEGGGCGTRSGAAARGLGGQGGGLWTEGSREEEETSEQGLGDIVSEMLLRVKKSI